MGRKKKKQPQSVPVPEVSTTAPVSPTTTTTTTVAPSASAPQLLRPSQATESVPGVPAAEIRTTGAPAVPSPARLPPGFAPARSASAPVRSPPGLAPVASVTPIKEKPQPESRTPQPTVSGSSQQVPPGLVPITAPPQGRGGLGHSQELAVAGGDAKGRGKGRGRGKVQEQKAPGPQQRAAGSGDGARPKTVQTQPTVQVPEPLRAPPKVRRNATAEVQQPKQAIPAAVVPQASAQAPSQSMQLTEMQAHLPHVSKFSPPRRKGYGTLGRPIRLRANHFPVRFQRGLLLYHYDVDIKPEIQAMKNLKRKIISVMLEQSRARFGTSICVFDGEKNIYSNLPLPSNSITVNVTLPEEGGGQAQRRRNDSFTVAVNLAATIDLSLLEEFLQGRRASAPQNAIQALDIIMRYKPSLNFVTIGRSIFPNKRGEYLDEGIEMWTGYYQSLRPVQWKILTLNLDVSHRTFYKKQSVLDYIVLLFRLENVHELRQIKAGSSDWEIVDREMKGLKVEVTHTTIKRGYRIIGVTSLPAELLKFPLERDGTTVNVTVAEYFLQTYKVRLQFPYLPCLQAQPKDRNRYLPMEFCTIPEGQQYRRINNDKITSQMIRKTAIPAPDRQYKIEQLAKTADFKGDEFLKAFGLSVSDQMLAIDGRVLEPPLVMLNKEVVPRNGVWDMRDHHFNNPASVSNWGIVCFGRCDKRDIDGFVAEMRRSGASVGMQISNYSFWENMDSRANAQQVQNSFTGLVKKYGKPNIIFVILPGKTYIYAEVKRVCDTIIGVPTQCVQMRNMRPMKPTTAVNILMKVNAKLGGRNSVLGRSISMVFQQPVMFFGADVTHPPAGDRSKPSIAAVVASMDKTAQTYKAKVLVQEHRVEIIQRLKDTMKDLLIEFRHTTNYEPKRIIFYRDGVGEGQFQEVLNYELVAIRRACSELSADYKPAITFIVVQKRHHTRLFCEDSRDSIGRSRNVPPGTTVDRCITHPTENDFFLCSHQGIQGTSRPTHYHILWDDSDFEADELQKLTYQLCHTYTRCTRSVSIPAPAYYAHLVAFRARHHLEDFQRSLPRDAQVDEVTRERMQRLVEAHSSLEKMYYV